MSIELRILAWSVVLGLVQILLQAHSASLQVGYRWTAVAREARPPLTGVAGRLERALRNFLETFPLFAAAVLAVHGAGRVSPPASEGPLFTGFTADPGPVPEGCALGLTLDTFSLMSHSPCVLSHTIRVSEPTARPASASQP